MASGTTDYPLETISMPSLNCSSYYCSTPKLANLPPPPKRQDFPTQKAFEEAKSGWDHRVAPVLAARRSRSKRPPSLLETIRMENNFPEHEK